LAFIAVGFLSVAFGVFGSPRHQLDFSAI
jgi:hypothetical protein